MLTKFTCIIPFYNESARILPILSALSKVKVITQIIAVDDGSTEKLPEITFPHVEIIKMPVNAGKSLAVKKAIEKAKNEHIMLFDADYLNVKDDEIASFLRRYTDLNVDMLLVEVKGGNNAVDRIFKKQIVFTGFRIMKKIDLIKSYEYKPKKYQLEAAINFYMMEHNKKVFWIPSNIINIHKAQKWGRVNGFIQSIEMEVSILYYLGLKNLFNQIIYLTKK